MLLTPVYARTMTMDEYGFNSTINTWFSLISTVVTADLSASVYRSKYEFPGQIKSYVSSITVLGSLITFAFFVLYLIFPRFFEQALGCRAEYFYLMFFVWMISPSLAMFQSINRLENKYKLVVAISLGSFVLSSAFNLLFLLSDQARSLLLGNLHEDRVLSMHIGGSIPGIIIYLIVYAYIMKTGKKLFNRVYWKFSLSMCIPLIPHLLAGHILSSSDKIMITNLCGTEFTALYSVTYTCSAVISMFFNALNEAWVPWFNDKYFYHQDKTVKKISLIYSLIFFVMTMGIVLVAPEILNVIGGKNYLVAKIIMPIVMSSCFFQFCNAFFVNIEMFEKKTAYTATGTMIAAGLNVGLNYLLLPKYGYEAAAWTTLIGFLFLFIYHTSVCIHLVKKRLFDVYNMKYIVIFAGVILLLIMPMQLLYEHTAIRYLATLIVLLVGTLIFIRRKNEIIPMLKQIVRSKG